MEGIPKSSSPYDTKLRREVALLLHLGEVTVKEVMELYTLEEPYKQRLYVWRHRAGKKYDRMNQTAQENARKEAIQRFYGTSGASVRVAKENAPTLDSGQIMDDPDIQAFIAETPKPVIPEVIEAEEPKKQSQIAKNLALSLDVSKAPIVDNPINPDAYQNELKVIKSNGVEQCSETLKTLQNLTPDIFVQESEIFSSIMNRLQTFSLQGMKVRDIKTFVETFEKALTLRRKAFILPFGHVDPNAKEVMQSSNHLHLHNHGTTTFNPNKSGT